MYFLIVTVFKKFVDRSNSKEKPLGTKYKIKKNS